MAFSRIWTDVNFEEEGKQIGNLYLPYQTNKSANGHICTPVCVIKNGDGPTVMLTAGVHGDEYEGQVALRKLVHETDHKDIRGRLLIFPSLNLPASAVGQRLSPIDSINLHGAFPGDPNSIFPTQELAFYIESHIMPMADYLVDLHSGGSSSDYMPFCSIRVTGDEQLDQKGIELLKVFGAPLSMIWKRKNGRMLSSAAERNKVVALGGEFGGQGTLSPDNLAIVDRGVERILIYLGIKAQRELPSLKTVFVEASGSDYFIYSKTGGIFEPSVKLGDEVQKGQECGKVYQIQDLSIPPKIHKFQRDGLVICTRHSSVVSLGDCLMSLATYAPI